jgi:hypothetical protein
MLTGAFAMGAEAMGALKQSTVDAQAALNSTSGEEGAIDAIRTIGMANLEARSTLRAASHPDQPIEHRATYAILEHTQHAYGPEEVRARYAKQRRQVVRALYRSYHHERLQLEALQPQDEEQRRLIEQRLSELPDAAASLAEMLGDETPLDVPDDEPAAEPEVASTPEAGISQALGFATQTAQPDTVATSTQRETVAAAVSDGEAQDETEQADPRFDRALGADERAGAKRHHRPPAGTGS